MELCPKRKVLFLALAVCMIFSLVFAELVLADAHDHDCIGEGCPVCLQIEAANNFFKSLKLAGLLYFLAVCAFFLFQTPPRNTEFAIYIHSPIDLKVRFNS
jgi:hypothetical protein